MDRVIMRLEVMGAETLGKINEFFRKKVQLEEQLKDNEINIHFHRGILFALNKAQEIVKEIQKGELIESMPIEGSMKPGSDHPKETGVKV